MMPGRPYVVTKLAGNPVEQDWMHMAVQHARQVGVVTMH
jgi:hypothetical protein